MFETLSERLSEAFRKITGRGVLTESDVKQAMRHVRRALLEADVNFRVARDFIGRVTDRAVGERVLRSIDPGKQVIKIVNDEIVDLLGTEPSVLELSGQPPIVYLLIGLQGSGKTTTAARLAWWLSRNRGKRVMLVACDLQRPAAIDQLEKLAEGAEAGFFCRRDTKDPAAVLKDAMAEARLRNYDIVVADTAGRLHVDDALMSELSEVSRIAEPSETLLVLDGLSGQDAVTVAEEFQKRIGFTGSVITKMDGDSRGGAALSFRAVTGRPIKFIGTGEKVDGLELMDPRRLAGRILGMGDVVGLVEKAQEAFDIDEAMKLEKKLISNSFTLEDFSRELGRIRKLGSLSDLLGMLPRGLKPQGVEIDESQFTRMSAIIGSMTRKERLHPEIINGSRRKRIAMGSGTRVNDVNRLLREFGSMKKMMKRMRSGKGMTLPGALR
ncbi:MAG: signal recognition particle protein [Candidatus Fermentibacteraceae bacterium]|nr:signal recognition particle protein [Candidatus Fermentibacteraceae bacterium]